jgi:hypothetical protein
MHTIPRTSARAELSGFVRMAARVAVPAELALWLLVSIIPSDSLDQQLYLFYVGLAWCVAGCAITLILYRWYVRPDFPRWRVFRGTLVAAIAAWPIMIPVSIALTPLHLPMKSESAAAPVTLWLTFSLAWLALLALCGLVASGRWSVAGDR